MANKWVYMFSEGNMSMRNLLGGHRRAGGRFAMGRAERRTGRTGVQALPAARMERVGGDHAPAGRVRQGASCVEYFDPDA